MRVRHVAALAACLVLVPGAVTVAVLASSADAAVTAIEGQLLAPDTDPAPQGYAFDSVSNAYFTFAPGPGSELRPQPVQVRSTTDGSVVSESPVNLNNPYDVPELVGRSTVSRTTTAAGTTMTFTGLGGAPSPAPITVPAGDTVLAVHEKGVLVSHREGTTDQLQVRTGDGIARVVSGVSPQSDAVVVDRDADTLLLRNYRQLYTVDVAAATAALVIETPDPLTWTAMTPGRVVWQTTGSVQQLAWKSRDGSASGLLDLPFTDDLTTFGDDVAVLKVPANGSYLRREVVQVALADGKVSTPAIDDVAAARALDDGRLLVARTDSVLALSPDLSRTTLAQIPPPVLAAGYVAISGGRVVDGLEDGTVHETTLTANQWTARSDIPIVDNPGNDVQLGGDNLLTYRDLVIRWPGGQRALDKNGAAELGRGGALLSYLSFSDQSKYSIQNPRTGAVLATRSTALPLAMDGTWVWQGPDPQTGVITGTDLPTGQTRKITSSVRCPSTLAVAGRWALASCSSHERFAVDLLGVVADYQLPDNASSLQELAAVGDGFVARFRITTDAHGLDVPELLVTDLNSPSHPERVVGPLRGRFWPPGASFALDDKAARIVYVDPESRVRVVTVNWLADITAPTLTSASAGPRTAPTRALSYTYSFTDAASGVASYDVRYQQRPKSTSPYGAWQQPAGWQKITGTKVTMTAGPGVDTCFQVRARDKAGNTSGWSASGCSTVESTPPRLLKATTASRVALTNPVRFSYAFTDDHAIGSYDVAYRSAPAGRTLGAWVYPSGWQAIRSTTVSLTPAVGADTCFIARARDAAGNVSAWSPMACAAAPQDDRAFAATGSVSRVTYAGAYRTTLSRLNRSGAALSKDGEIGKRIAVTVLAGPSQGAVDVSFAGHRIGRVSLAATTWSRKVYYLPVTPWYKGRVTVTSVSTLPSSIDGVALLRY